MTAASSAEKLVRRFNRPQICHQVKVEGVELWIGCASGKVGKPQDLGIFVFCASDARSIVDGYSASSGATPDFLQGEMRRLSRMSVDEWEDFLRVREGYNPFADRRNRQRSKSGDKRLRKQYAGKDFKSDKQLSASCKRALVHAYERFLVARIFGGKGHAVSRLDLALARALTSLTDAKAFDGPKSLYHSYFSEIAALKAHLKAVSRGRDLYGNVWRLPHDTSGDATAAMIAIAKAYGKCG